jgi:hypothetical protein
MTAQAGMAGMAGVAAGRQAGSRQVQAGAAGAQLRRRYAPLQRKVAGGRGFYKVVFQPFQFLTYMVHGSLKGNLCDFWRRRKTKILAPKISEQGSLAFLKYIYYYARTCVKY